MEVAKTTHRTIDPISSRSRRVVSTIQFESGGGSVNHHLSRVHPRQVSKVSSGGSGFTERPLGALLTPDGRAKQRPLPLAARGPQNASVSRTSVRVVRVLSSFQPSINAVFNVLRAFLAAGQIARSELLVL